ncbi:MAG: RDD family protein [Jatrophihabitans sp.]
MTAPQAYRGEQIGLPQTGAGSLATGGPRFGAFVVDALASGLIAALFVSRGHGSGGLTGTLPGSWSLIPFVIDYVVGSLVAGRTLGMYLFGLRLVRVDTSAPVDPRRIAIRTLLLVLLVPALVFDRDGRGLHDRFSDTAVVKA